jgi:hypothetical protein
MFSERCPSGTSATLFSIDVNVVDTVLTLPVGFLHVLATYLQSIVIEVQAGRLHSMSVKRRYSTFAIDHARYAQLFFSLISYVVENTECLNYKNQFFGLSTYLAKKTVCLILKTMMGKVNRRTKVILESFPILTKIGTCRQVWVKIPDEKFQTFLPVGFALIRAERQTGTQKCDALRIYFTKATTKHDIK